jgi:hypothetical protein
VLDAIGNKAINEAERLAFTVTATDPDGNGLTFSAGDLPPGAVFDLATQIFSWTPDYGQSGNFPNVRFTVTDDGEPPASDSESITITVNEAPLGSNSRMHINDIEVIVQKNWLIATGIARVQIVDAYGYPVEDATIIGQWSGDAGDTDQFNTDLDGWGTTESDWRWGGNTFTFCVTDVIKDGWMYDVESDVISCESSY